MGVFFIGLVDIALLYIFYLFWFCLHFYSKGEKKNQGAKIINETFSKYVVWLDQIKPCITNSQLLVNRQALFNSVLHLFCKIQALKAIVNKSRGAFLRFFLFLHKSPCIEKGGKLRAWTEDRAIGFDYSSSWKLGLPIVTNCCHSICAKMIASPFM